MRSPIIISILVLLLIVMSCNGKDGNPVDVGLTVNYGGKTYHIVSIGNQQWLKENLDVGTMIVGDSDQTNDGKVEKYCYNDDPANCTLYGGLYQWDEAMQYSPTPGAQGICPAGWHIPTRGEFQTLYQTVGAAGNDLKALGQGVGDGAGTNGSGFSALLAGDRATSGAFDNLGTSANIWSSTEVYSGYLDYLFLESSSQYIVFNEGEKYLGLSVRCIED